MSHQCVCGGGGGDVQFFSCTSGLIISGPFLMENLEIFFGIISNLKLSTFAQRELRCIPQGNHISLHTYSKSTKQKLTVRYHDKYIEENPPYWPSTYTLTQPVRVDSCTGHLHPYILKQVQHFQDHHTQVCIERSMIFHENVPMALQPMAHVIRNPNMHINAPINRFLSTKICNKYPYFYLFLFSKTFYLNNLVVQWSCTLGLRFL